MSQSPAPVTTLPAGLAGKVNALLAFLVVLDLALSAVAIAMPNVWAKLMHGQESWEDPHHMLRRLGAVWLGFLVVQAIALLRWKSDPVWLAIVAGVRWTELCADGVYWASAEQLTWFGHLGFLSSPPWNIIFGVFLLRAYRQAIGARAAG